MNDIEIIRLTDDWPEQTVRSLEVEKMTIIQQTIDVDETPALRVPRAWLERNAPEQLECTCPESCLLDHDN
jgi:hypothetical protein